MQTKLLVPTKYYGGFIEYNGALWKVDGQNIDCVLISHTITHIRFLDKLSTIKGTSSESRWIPMEEYEHLCFYLEAPKNFVTAFALEKAGPSGREAEIGKLWKNYAETHKVKFFLNNSVKIYREWIWTQYYSE